MLQPLQYARTQISIGVRHFNKAAGLVGYPNVGKSTMFNAFVGSAMAEASNYPFCTIEPNVCKVAVPDPRLDRLAEIAKAKRTIHGQVEIRDIAGIIKGASSGAGMGNQFLSHIRGVSMIMQVVRCFSDDRVTHVVDAVNIDPIKEFEDVMAELLIADLEVAQKRIPALTKKAHNCTKTERALPIFIKIKEALEAEKTARSVLSEEDWLLLANMEVPFLTAKPTMVLCNVDPASIRGNEYTAKLTEHLVANRGFRPEWVIPVCATLEEEAASLANEDVAFQQEYLESFGVQESVMPRVLRTAQDLLGITAYYTCGVQEARSWFVRKGAKGPEAAAAIHGDFEKNFMAVEVWNQEDVEKLGSMPKCKAAGLVKQKGKDYVVQEGDILEFKIKNAKS